MLKELKCYHVPQETVKFNLPCPSCGKQREYATQKSLERAAFKKAICPSCRTVANNKKRKGTKTKEKNPAWKGYKDIPGKVLSKLKRDAKVRNIAFNITIENIQEVYEKQEKRCALSDVLLVWGETASVDRINSDKDYTVDNIQIVHKVLNMMKKDMEQELFIDWCCLVADAAAYKRFERMIKR
jgi:hypothetical protein